MKKMILMLMTVLTLPVLAGPSKTIPEHIAALQKEGISTEEQLCEYASRGSLVGNPWSDGSCKFPDMFSYTAYQDLYNNLKPHLSEVKPDPGLQSHIDKAAESEEAAAEGDIAFAGISGKMSYSAIAKQLCSLDFVTSVDGAPKAEFCQNPPAYIVSLITFRDGSQESFTFKDKKFTVVTDNSVKLMIEKIVIEGVEFKAKLEFDSARWRDIDAIKGMLIRGDIPLEFMGGPNYVGKYYLDKITLSPTTADNMKLFDANYASIMEFFVTKFGDNVLNSTAYNRKTDYVEVNGLVYEIKPGKEIRNSNPRTIRYIFKGNEPDFASYKAAYIASKKSSASNTDI